MSSIRSGLLAICLLLVLPGCRGAGPAWSADGAASVQIFDSKDGIAARPSDLRVLPGQEVVFFNNTSYDIDLSIDYGKGEKPSIARIAPFSKTGVKAQSTGKAGYVLYFNSVRNFGKINGTITVEGGPEEKEAPPQEPASPSPPSLPSPSEPEII